MFAVLAHCFLIDAILHHLYQSVVAKTGDGTRSGLLRYTEHLHKLLRLEFLGQLAETLAVAGAALTYHKLLVLIGKVVKCHLAEKELLRLILDLHHYPTETLVYLVHRKRVVLLPLIPMAHQDERQRDADAIIRNTL